MSLDLNGYRAVLLDLDGTLYHEDDALPGGAALVRHLRERPIPFACLSNSTTSPARVIRRLATMGIDVVSEQIYTASVAAADYVLKRFGGPGTTRRPRIFNLATEGVQDILDGKVDWVSDGGECDAVIIGAPSNAMATEPRQRLALKLVRSGALPVGVCADRIYPSPRGFEFGSGALTSMLCYAAKAKPVYCGKPEEFFFHELCRRLDVSPGDCLLIGDNIESDIVGARRLGMRTILTLTGVSSRADALAAPVDYRPDSIVNDLTELL
jgi:4-nitrophenyl phosphatase